MGLKIGEDLGEKIKIYSMPADEKNPLMGAFPPNHQNLQINAAQAEKLAS